MPLVAWLQMTGLAGTVAIPSSLHEATNLTRLQLQMKTKPERNDYLERCDVL